MGKVKGQRTIQVDTAGRPGGPPAGGDRKAPLPWEATSKKCGVGGGVYLQDVTEFAHMTDVTFKAQA